MAFHYIASWQNIEYVCQDHAEILIRRSDWHQAFNVLPIILLGSAAKPWFGAPVKKRPGILQNRHAGEIAAIPFSWPARLLSGTASLPIVSILASLADWRCPFFLQECDWRCHDRDLNLRHCWPGEVLFTNTHLRSQCGRRNRDL
jgi:hypothetical protein